MAAFVSSLTWLLIKFIGLGLVAFVGILCGKKYREKKDAAKNK